MAPSVEEFDAPGDHFELLAASAVLGLPFGVLQASFDSNAAPLGEVLVAYLGLVAEHGDVDVVGAAVLAVLAGSLDREPQAADLGSGSVVQFGVGGQTAGEVDYLELGEAGLSVAIVVMTARFRWAWTGRGRSAPATGVPPAPMVG